MTLTQQKVLGGDLYILKNPKICIWTPTMTQINICVASGIVQVYQTAQGVSR